MELSGRGSKIIQTALLDAYTIEELRRMVRFELNENLDRIAGSDTFDTVTFALIDWASVLGGCET